MGDWLSGTSGWKYPNQYESWIGYASKNRLADSHPMIFAPRLRFYPPPRADAPSEGSRSPSLLSGYHMSHANTWHMLSDITFVCGERLDDTPKTIPNKNGTVLPQRDFFQKLWSWQPPASLPGLQRLKWFSLPGIDRSRKADMAEIKPEVARGTEFLRYCRCFWLFCFLDPRSLKIAI